MRYPRNSEGLSLLGRFPKDGGDALVRAMSKRALAFGGVNEYVTLDPLAVPLAASQAWTVSYWIRHPGPTAAGQNLFNINRASGGNVALQTFLGSTNYIAVFGGSSWVTAGRVNTTNVLDGEWHHVLISVNHAANRLDWYVDGVLEQGAGSTVFPTITNTDLVTVGAEWDSPGPTVGNFWAGDILGIALWFDTDDHAARAAALHAAGPSLNLRQWVATKPDRWYMFGALPFLTSLPDLMLSSDVATYNNIVVTDVIESGA